MWSHLNCAALLARRGHAIVVLILLLDMFCCAGASEHALNDDAELGLKLFQAGRYYEARKIFEAILENSVSRANLSMVCSVRFNLASVCRSVGDPQAAIQNLEWFFETVDCSTGNNVDVCNSTDTLVANSKNFKPMYLVYIYLGELYAEQGKIDKALKHFKSALASNADSNTFRMLSSSVGITLKRIEHRLAEGEVASFDDLVSAGLLRESSGDPAIAKKHLKRALRMDPEATNAMVHVALGRLATAEKKYKVAVKHLKRAVALQPSVADHWLALGNAHNNRDDPEPALEAYQRGISSDQTSHRCVVSAMRIMRELGREAERQELAESAVANGSLLHVAQTASHLVRNLTTAPWHDPTTWRVRQVLRQHFVEIQREIIALLEEGQIDREGIPDTEDLVLNGVWTELNLFHQGRTFEKNCKLAPVTSEIIRRELPEAVSMVHGATKISVLVPGTQTRPHSGHSNTRMRVHLGVAVPPGASINVGGDGEEHRRSWIEGDVIAFDDSFEHSVSHYGARPRVVLIIDIWHPDMTEEVRVQALADEPEKLQVYIHHKEKYRAEGLEWF